MGMFTLFTLNWKWGPEEKMGKKKKNHRCPHRKPVCVHFLTLPFFLSQVAMVTWIQSITLQMAECVIMRWRNGGTILPSPQVKSILQGFCTTSHVFYFCGCYAEALMPLFKESVMLILNICTQFQSWTFWFRIGIRWQHIGYCFVN